MSLKRPHITKVRQVLRAELAGDPDRPAAAARRAVAKYLLEAVGENRTVRDLLAEGVDVYWVIERAEQLARVADTFAELLGQLRSRCSRRPPGEHDANDP